MNNKSTVVSFVYSESRMLEEIETLCYSYVS